MLNPKMETELNKQINEELYSAYLYQSMSAYFASKNLRGFAHWMDTQSKEEIKHARKFYDYIIERLGKVVLDAIAKPPVEWDSALSVLEATYKHEQHVTARINLLSDISMELKDKATQNWLNWFIGEQVEEEASADEFVQMLKMVGNNNQGLFMVDHEMAKRG